MSETNFDLIVVGGGPGGYVAAIRSSQLGFKTALIERDRIGGRCLNYACIPAKAVLRSADVLAEVRAASTYGVVIGDAQPQIDFAAVAKRRDRVVKTLTGGVAGLMKRHNVTVVEGSATLAPSTDAETANLLVSGAEGQLQLSARFVVLATGSLPKSILGVEFAGRVVDTTGAWLQNERPASLAVVGAGASGVEIASAYGRFGTAVTLIEVVPQILPAEDIEIAQIAAKELAKQNIEILTSANLAAIDNSDNQVVVDVNGEQRSFEQLCIAAGRAPDVVGLGLEQYGIGADDLGLIAVDEFQRTSDPRIFAIGDLVRGPALAHKASEEGVLAVEVAAGHGDVQPIIRPDIPRATFCSPQIASFGLTEAQAQAAGNELRVGRFAMAAAGAATVYGDRTGLVKIVGDANTGELIGGHIVGPKAADMIVELAVAKAAQIGYQELARVVHPHPTVSEAVMEAARDADGWLIHG